MREAPCLASWLEAGTRQYPDRLALSTPQRRWTYRELAGEAKSCGSRLRQSILPQVDIAAIAGNANELAIAALACSIAGLAFFPLDPATADQRWPALLVLAGERLQRLPPLTTDLPDNNRPVPTASNPLALVIATSGSEGSPKAVMLTHANLDAAAAASHTRLPLSPGDLWLGCLPLHHIGGMSTLYRCLRAGATLRLHDGFDAEKVWFDLQEQAITHISLVPAMLARLLDVANGSPPPATLRHALIGGAALSQQLFSRARASAWPLHPTWGMSECAAQVATVSQPDDHWQEGEVGTLLPGFECRIDDDGRLHLRGPQVMAGYLNRECRPGDGLNNGWLATADIGRMDDAGRLTILCRADDVLNSGGVKTHPREIESCLATCPGVSDVAVTALADPVWGDLLVALFVGNADAHEVEAWGRQELSSAHRPRQHLKVRQLPRNTMGKIERSALRALAETARARSREAA